MGAGAASAAKVRPSTKMKTLRTIAEKLSNYPAKKDNSLTQRNSSYFLQFRVTRPEPLREIAQVERFI